MTARSVESAPGAPDRARPAVTVIGVGNRYRHDDAAGLEVARLVRAGTSPAVRVVELEGEPIDILDAWAGSDVVIVADAVSGSGNPGRIHALDGGSAPVPVPFRSKGTHAFSLADVVELARATGRLPPRVVVYGIEGDTFSAGEGLSPEVKRAVDETVAKISHQVGGI